MLNIKWATNGYATYPGFAFKLIAAIIAANGVILFEEKPKLLFILSNKGFYIASAVSCVFAYIIINLVFYITMRLDAKYPWTAHYSKRFSLQLIFAVIAPVLPLFLAASIYFHVNGINVLDTVYIRRYIPLILLLLIILSAYLHYLWVKENGFSKKAKLPAIVSATAKTLPVPAEKVACLFAKDKNCFVVNFDGIKEGWELTLKESMLLLPSSDFYRINRSFVINRNAIANVEVINKKQTMVQIKDSIYETANETASWIITEVTPSTRENTKFKRWYEEGRSKAG